MPLEQACTLIEIQEPTDYTIRVEKSDTVWLYH